LDAEGIDKGLEDIRSLECNRVLVSVNYHRCRMFRPRDPSMGFHYRPFDFLDFEPDTSLYGPDCPLPPVNTGAAGRGLVRRIREACGRAGVEFTASVIGCHNTSMGLAWPRLTACNFVGDRYAFALCPANPEVRAYLRALVEDVCRQFSPGAILLDSFTYLGTVHREHHELMFVRPGLVGEHLLSLCFCRHCEAAAAAGGVDIVRLKALVRSLLSRLLAREGADAHDPDREGLAALLFEYPELYAFEQARRQVVTSLLAEIRDITKTCSVGLDSISGLLARPCTRSWTEGSALQDRAALCDHIYLQSYFQRTNMVAEDLRWAVAALPSSQIVLANMVGESHIASCAELKERVLLAAEAGLAGVSYYNYGLLNPMRLGWLREANQALAPAHLHETNRERRVVQ
jgi:hypothetical protein